MNKQTIVGIVNSVALVTTGLTFYLTRSNMCWILLLLAAFFTLLNIDDTQNKIKK